MNTLFLAFVFSLAATSLAAQSAFPQGPRSKSNNEECSVEGTVLRLDTGQPLKKAVVTLANRENGEKSVLDLTDDLGHFHFEEIEAGSYDLSVSRSGFVSAECGQRKAGDPGAVLTLHRGQTVTDLIFKLQRNGVIAGRVFDEDGDPVVGANVLAYQLKARERRGFRRASRFSGTTNDSGEYRLFGLNPGKYYLEVRYQRWPEPYRRGVRPANRLHEGYLAPFTPEQPTPQRRRFWHLAQGKKSPASIFR